MNRVRPVRRWIALGLLLAACAAPALRQPPAQRHRSADASAFLFISPNTSDDLDLITARQRIDTPDHARFRRLAGAMLRKKLPDGTQRVLRHIDREGTGLDYWDGE